MASGQKDAIVVRQISEPVMVVGADGQPLARVAAQISALIGLPAYSNVTVGPIMIERWVENTKEARLAALAEINEEIEEIAAHQRKLILDSMAEAGVKR